MTRERGLRHAWLVPVAGLLLTVLACGDDKYGASSGTPAVAPPGALTVTARDNKFEPVELSTKSGGETTLFFQNKGSAIHNFRVPDAKSTDGKEIGTDLLGGGKSATIAFVIDKAGTYNYQCDTHPAEMRGRITVQ
jgi:plastocyanin